MNRLEYIGSKFKLQDWLSSELCKSEYTKVADLFAGTGIVSHLFNHQTHITHIVSNDAELYSSIITEAMIACDYSTEVQRVIDELNEHSMIDCPTPILDNYSPKGECKRMFFTEQNALYIDLVRYKLECKYKHEELSYKDYIFILASIIVSADKVSNTASVYGAYLKNFKQRALATFTILPIHTKIQSVKSRIIHNTDILDTDTLDSVSEFDLVYLDPPYNSRQYSKNYFPLNIIAKGCIPVDVLLGGKTGIPSDCFVSSFCSKRNAYSTFQKLFTELFKRKVKRIVVSYNSESILSKDDMIECLKTAGATEIQVKEKDYQRFKSSNLSGQDKGVIEYLFIGTL